jgi:hypothetical protein
MSSRIINVALLLTLAVMPFAASAQSTGFFSGNLIIPEECQCRNQPAPDGTLITTAPDFGCVLQVAQNVLNAIFYFAIILVVLYIVYVGFLYLSAAFSGNSPGNLSAAKTRIVNVVVGVIVILAAWLIVDFVMKSLYDDAEFGPWNRILAGEGSNRCIVANEPKGIISGTVDIILGNGGNSVPAPGEIIESDGTIPGRICAAASAYRGTSTRNAPGTQNGKLACAWAVNEVLQRASIKPIGNSSVRVMESALQGGRGMRVAQGSARCGDIVLITESRGSHVGICMNAGCTSVISNSSSNRSFTWMSTPDFKPSYKSGAFRIYRVTK